MAAVPKLENISVFQYTLLLTCQSPFFSTKECQKKTSMKKQMFQKEVKWIGYQNNGFQTASLFPEMEIDNPPK